MGHIKGIEGGKYINSPVDVLVVNDFITYKKKLIKQSQTDANGNFKLTFENSKTNIAILKLGKVERTLFIEPGGKYFISIEAALKKLSNSKGFFAKDSKKATIRNSIKGELNYLIDTLDKSCSKFLLKNAIKRKNYKSVKLFTDSIKKQYSNQESLYFKQYLSFKIAEMQMFVMRKFRNDFVKHHFTPNSNYANNVQSMHVINSFFSGNIKHNILSNDNSPFHKAMLQTNLNKMLIEVSPNTSENRELNELILLKGLVEISEVFYYRKSHLTATLDKLIATTIYPNHKEIAKNIKNKITHLEVGITAPALSIKYDETNFDLLDYQGKYVYLCFFRGWDLSFKKEFEIINYLRYKYKENLEIVCISTDIDIKIYKNFIEQIKDDIDHIYHYNFDHKILLDYKIPDFRMQETNQWQKPSKYLLIGPVGDIVFNNAKSPSKGFEYDFRLLIGK
ncbi:MAG: hypothetical protein CMD18_02490 [Flavobacteriales bacterium]|nr:hypothetical protein [Flavobacteriales bacterium]